VFNKIKTKNLFFVKFEALAGMTEYYYLLRCDAHKYLTEYMASHPGRQ
jgi:hypothetical protein